MQTESPPLYKDSDEAVIEYPSQGPALVSLVFKVAAVLLLLAGAISAASTGIDLSRNSSLSTSSVIGISIGIAAGAVLAAAAVAFFAYVLDLLLDIRFNSEVAAQMALFPDQEDD